MKTMNLDDAIQTHADWKTRFRAAILTKQTLDVATISKDDCCELGKWLVDAGKSHFVRWDSYRDCVEMHRTFHVEASKVANAINARKFAEAGAMIAPGAPYSAAANMIATAIMLLKKESSRDLSD
jgi:methyl-accepting chemotaxis protein